MPIATIINRNVFKTVSPARCFSWYSNYVQRSSKQTLNREQISIEKRLATVIPSAGFQCRFKYDKSSRKKGGQDEDEDATDTNKELHEADGNDTKITTIKVTSLRMDLVVKSALNLARNKVEAAFYDSRIRVNGKKVSKKSVSLHIGDEVDVIKSVSPVNNEHLIVSRLELLKATPNEEDISLALRRYKSLTIENYSGQNAYKQVVNTAD